MESGRNVPGEENKYLSRRNTGERNPGAGPLLLILVMLRQQSDPGRWPDICYI